MAEVDDARSYGDRGALRAPSRPKAFNRSDDKAVILGCQQAIQSSKALLLRTSEASRTSPNAGADDSGSYILQVFYSSRIPDAKDLQQKQDDIDNIVRVSRKGNASQGITGVLVANTRMYSQIIEGPSSSIKDLIGRISCDARHEDIRSISRDISTKRLFPDWSMGFILRDQELELDDKDVPGVSQKDSSSMSSFCSSIGIRTI